MQSIPRDAHFDSTLALLREGYPFIQNRCRPLQTDVFRTRLGGMKTICLHGPEAAKLFYDPAWFARHGALPNRVLNTLMGQRGVQTLDGARPSTSQGDVYVIDDAGEIARDRRVDLRAMASRGA